MIELAKSFALLLVLLNPFLVIIYLADMVDKLDMKSFTRTLIHGSLIATVVFCSFAILGDFIFSSIVQAEFASFQIFGGIVFLMISLQFVFGGPTSIQALKGDSKGLAGAIAMPVLIGPGTISACVVIGKRHEVLNASATIVAAVFVSVAIMLALKALHDFARPRHEPAIQRYIEVSGRITALYVGTVSIEMIMQGLRTWAGKF